MRGRQEIKKYFTYVSEDFAASVFRVQVLKITFHRIIGNCYQMTWYHILENLTHGQLMLWEHQILQLHLSYLQNVYEPCFVIFNAFCLMFLFHEWEWAKYFIIQGGADVSWHSYHYRSVVSSDFCATLYNRIFCSLSLMKKEYKTKRVKNHPVEIGIF